MSGWVAGATVGAAVISSAASSKASKSQERANRESIASQERMFDKQVELQEPFRKVGVNALPDLVEASKYDPFTTAKFKADPGYAFRLEEGLKALDRSAASRGGLLSGATLKGAQRYGQDLGSQEYTNAFNRYQIERNARLNPLQSLAGMSQSATNTLTGAAGQFGQNMAESAMTQGNIRASGYTNQANALTGALNQGLKYYQNQQTMDRFFPPRPGYNQTASLQNWSQSQQGYLDPDYMGP